MATVSVIQIYVNTTSTTAVSDAFDINNGDLIVVAGHCNQGGDSSPDNLTLTDNDVDLAFTAGPSRGSGEADAGLVSLWYYLATRSDTGVIVTLTTGASNDTPYLKIWRVTGADLDTGDILGAVNEASYATDPASISLTLETNGLLFGAWTDWNATDPTATSSDLDDTGFVASGVVSGGSGWKATSSGAQTGDINSSGAPDGNWVALEVRLTAGGAATPIYRSTRLTMGVGR